MKQLTCFENRLICLENKWSRFFWISIGYIFVAVVGFADFITGTELSFSFFYLIPIVLVTWFLGRNQGLIVSIISAITWFLADFLAEHVYSLAFIAYWNAGIRLSTFLLVTLLYNRAKSIGI